MFLTIILKQQFILKMMMIMTIGMKMMLIKVKKKYFILFFFLQKSDDMEDSKIEVEHYGSNIIYDNKTYKAGVKEDDVYIIYL